MGEEKRGWPPVVMFALAAAGIIGVVIAFNINLARYKELLGMLSALGLFSAYLVTLLYAPPTQSKSRLLRFEACDLWLVLFLFSGLMSYYFVDYEYRDTAWVTWFKFFVYGLLFWSVAHALTSARLVRKLLDLWLGTTMIICIYGFSQYFQVDFFFFLRPAVRLFEATGNADLYVSLLFLPLGILWGLLLYYYQSLKPWLAGGLATVLGLASYFVLVNYFGPVFPRELADRRIFSTCGNANMYSAYLVLVSLIALGLLAESVREKQMGRVWFYLVAEFLVGFNLLLTQTRAGYLAVTLGVVLFLFWSIYSRAGETAQRLRLFSYIIGIMVLASVLLVAGIRFLTPGVYVKIIEVAYRQTARVYVWLGALRMLLAHPVFGVGIGTLAVFYPNFRPAELEIYHPRDVYFVRHAHNEFLEIGAEQGFLGLLLFLGFLVVFYHTVLPRLQREHPQRFVVIGLLAGISALLFHNLFSVDMRFISSAYFFWLSLAFTLVLIRAPELELGAPVMAVAAPGKKGKVPLVAPEVNLRRQAVKGVLTALLGIWLIHNVQVAIRPFQANVDLKKEADFFAAKNQDTQQIEALENKKKTGPMSDIEYFRLGNLYAKNNRWLEAISNLEEAVRINPQLFGALNNLGNIAFMHNRVADAVKFYQQAVMSLANKPTLTDREKTEINDARFNLGFAYFKQGELEKALTQFNQVLKSDPNHAKALKMRERLIE